MERLRIQLEASPHRAPAMAWLTLGERPLMLGPQPHTPLVLALAHALADALTGVRPVGVRLGEGYRLALTADGPTGLSVSVRRPRGPTVLRRQPLAREAARQTIRAWVMALTPAEGAHRALQRVAAARLAHLPPRPPTPAGPPRVWGVQHGLCERRAGPGHVASLLLGWLRTLARGLSGGSAAIGSVRLGLDADRAVRVWGDADGVWFGPVDAEDRPLAPARHGPLQALAAAAPALIDGQAGLSLAQRTRLSARAERLGLWASSLQAQTGAAPPPLALAPTPTPDVDALPVGGLFHLAYRRRWRLPIAPLLGADLAGGMVLLSDGDGTTAVDRLSGAVRWRAAGWRSLGASAAGLCLDSHGRIARRDPCGRIRWRAPDLPLPTRVLTDAAGPWLLVHDDGVIGLAGDRGTVIWRYAVAHSPLLGAALGPGGLWVTCGGRALVCLAPDTGALLARCVLPATPALAPVALDADVLLVDVDRGRHHLTRWRCGDPDPHWRVQVAEAPLDRPRVIDGSVAVVTGDPSAPRLTVFDATSGERRWSAPLPGGPRPPRVIGVAGRLIAKGLDGQVVALCPETGAVRWTLPPDDVGSLATRNPPPQACRGLVVVSAGTVRAVDPATGRVVHTVDTGPLMPDWVHVWPGGDLLIAEPEGAAFFVLEGHLALVS